MELTRLICVLALAGAVGACGSDITSTGDGTGLGPVDAGGDGGPTDACLNDDDAEVFANLNYTDDKGEESSGSEAASAIGSDCVLGATTIEGDCQLEAFVIVGGTNTPETRDALAACIETCTNFNIGEYTDPSGMLSEDCLSCYGAAASCGAAFCAGVCSSDVTAPGCVECREVNRCSPNFDTCSGFVD